MPVEEQVCVLYAGVRGFLDKIPTKDIGKFEAGHLNALRNKILLKNFLENQVEILLS